MLTKVYWLTWVAIALFAGIVFLSGNLTTMLLVILGFIAFGMVFMGMMNVLPTAVTHPSPKVSRQVSEEVRARTAVGAQAPHGVRSVHA